MNNFLNHSEKRQNKISHSKIK